MTKLEGRVQTKIINSKTWKHFKTLYVGSFPSKVEFNAGFVLLVVIKNVENV